MSNEPHENIKPGDSRELLPEPPPWTRLLMVVWAIPMFVAFGVGWLTATLALAAREGWYAALDWLEKL